MMFYDIYAMLVIILCGLISLIFFNSLFNRRYSIKCTILTNVVINCMAALVYLLKIPTANLIAFLLGNILFVNLMYDCKKRLSVLYVLILGAIMMLSEFFVVLVMHYCFNVEVTQLTERENVILYTVLCKSLYLFIVLLAKRIILKNKENDLYDNTYYFFLSFPIATMILLSGLYFVVYRLSDKESIILLVSVLPLLISEFVCYIVYDYIIEKNKNINLLKDNIFKNQLQLKEYDLYKQRYESSRIIVHDIKKHLSVIRELGINSEKANKYIDDFLALNDNKIIYTNNEVLNIILNEKMEECRRKGIKLSVNISTNLVNHLSDNDIVAIFCNLLDNAIESCDKSVKKTIVLELYATNDVFMTINMVNSCDAEPAYENGRLKSAKGNKQHGFGMLSIEKSVQKYGGYIEYTYDKEHDNFLVVVVINCKEN